jgi:regulator of sirC expression with transglutaminase-like and TPR domain
MPPRSDPTDRFAALVAGAEDAIHLDEAALLVAAHAKPWLDVDEELTRLDALAAACPDRTATALVAHLFGDLEFRGDEDDYYDPRNSFLDDVITRRRGIPITLSIVTIEVGRRIGVALDPIGMPGHFLVRDQANPGAFIDPFHGGTALDAPACRAVYERLRGPGAPWDESFLEPIGARAVVTRLLANLQGIFFSTDLKQAAWVVRLRLAIPGSSDGERRLLAQALVSLGQFADAADELDRLGLADDARRVRARTN